MSTPLSTAVSIDCDDTSTSAAFWAGLLSGKVTDDAWMVFLDPAGHPFGISAG
jgi:hypothetical protein